MRAALGLLVLLASGVAAAEEDVLPGQGQDETGATRQERATVDTPLSTSTVERSEFHQGKRAIGIEDSLTHVPGVVVQSAPNFAQDTRVSIRGYGARATFGVRGIKVYVDGVPTTLPDGQSEVDSIDLSFMNRVDVVRGPVSSLYGGGAGGVLSYTTVDPTDTLEARARVLYGSHNLSRYETLATGTGPGDVGYVAGFTATRFTGYRDHARGRQQNLLVKLQKTLDAGTELGASFGSVWAPEAQDPGGLNQDEVDEDRKQARTRAREFDTGERLDQQKVGLSLRQPLGEGSELDVRGYWLHRDFKNRLPFEDRGRVVLDRDVGGVSAVLRGEVGGLRWLFGADGDRMDDRRERYQNLQGFQGDLQLDQTERVITLGGFGELDWRDPSGFGVVAGGRYDWMEYKVSDRFRSDGDQSNRIRYREFSPRLGVYYDHSPAALVYANLLTAFRPPTTTELALPETGGFNSDLDPEKSRGVELGAKGLIRDRLFYELTGFYLQVRDAIVPFQNADEVTLGRNAAKVRRLGFESGLGLRLRPGLELRAAYTYSDFWYRDYKFESVATGERIDFDNNQEPNVPKHALSAELRYQHPSGLHAVLSVRHWSDIEVNDNNVGKSDSATISDFRLTYDWWRGRTLFRPFFSLRNWTGVEYDGQLRPNAAFGRYYEPAAETEVMGGVELRWGAGP